MNRIFPLRALAALVTCILVSSQPVLANEATTGTVVGVVTGNGKPVAHAQITISSPSGIYHATTDARGRFSVLGIVADTYTVLAHASGFHDERQTGVTVLPGATQRVSLVLVSVLSTIATVRARTPAFNAGGTSDSFTVSGAQATAISPPVSSSGLASYIGGTVQGAIASVPGVVLDQFANAILRGGKVSDAIFDYDSVPIPQGLIAEPGGNIVGAQLPTTGIASTTTTLAGYTTQGDNSLGGVIDEIPAVGTYPGSLTLESGIGIAGAQFQQNSLQWLDASPDLKWRYAFAATTGSQNFLYGNGSFLPAEAGTYGLALASRGEYSMESNVHYHLDAKDDLSVLGLVGQAAYTQYGTPYAGETVGELDGTNPATGAPVTYPGEVDPNEPVDYASGIRGSYSIIKAQWLHSGAHSLTRVQVYQSQYGSQAGGPFWDENGWPDGSISLSETQGSKEEGIGYDGEDLIGEDHDLRFGAEYRTNTSFLNQIVPTAGEFITSNPTIFSYLAYLGDTWHVTPRLDLMGTARFTDTHFIPSYGSIYDDGALDPHVALAYKLTNDVAARITYDHTTVAPLPLEADRVDSANTQPNGAPAPFVQLAPEIGNDVTYSIEGGRRVQFRATVFDINEQNLIDVLPYNFRSALAAGIFPNGVGVPTNVGNLRARGAEFWLNGGGFTLDTNFIRAYSSSASQFAYNDLNAPAVAAGVLFPVSYLPNFAATLSYEFHTRNRRLRITPSLSFESGYPYGNGKDVWIIGSNGKPEEVPNDNYVDPGYNYYFLKNPSEPYNAATNPYIGNLGTPEGDMPNTLHAPGETFLNLHVEGDLSPRVTAILDIVNVLDNTSPTSYQGNPYLIGPPGYAGGNALYAAAYEAAGGYSEPYTLGNGVPTQNGQTQSVPWSYGRAGYVPQNYPLGFTMQFRLRIRL